MGFTVGLGRGGWVAVGTTVGATVVAMFVGARLAVWAEPEQAANRNTSGSKNQAIEESLIFILFPSKLTPNNTLY